MFGYATDETPELMPLTHVLATQLGYKLTEAREGARGRGAAAAAVAASCAVPRPPGPAAGATLTAPLPCAPLPAARPPQVRKNGTCPWLRPDGKTQVTVEYRKDGGAVVPLRVHTILISTQHNPDVSNDKIKEDLMEHVIKPVVRCTLLKNKCLGWAGWVVDQRRT